MQLLRNQINSFLGGLLLLFILAGASVAHASREVGSIDPTYKYAWGSVAGYVNFGATNGEVAITDSGLSGYAWSTNDGWINLSPAQSGVKNDGSGTLSGFAWDSVAGWVNFSGVTIDSSGNFHGQATGGTVNGVSYAISFDCTYCDVRTDWWRASSRTGGVSFSPVATSTPAAVPNTALTQPTEPPVSTTLPSSGSPSSSAAAGVSGASGTKTSGIKISPPIITTTYKNTIVSPATTTEATSTPAKKTIAFSFFNFVGSVGKIIFNGLLSFFRFFVKF